MLSVSAMKVDKPWPHRLEAEGVEGDFAAHDPQLIVKLKVGAACDVQDVTCRLESRLATWQHVTCSSLESRL